MATNWLAVEMERLGVTRDQAKELRRAQSQRRLDKVAPQFGLTVDQYREVMRAISRERTAEQAEQPRPPKPGEAARRAARRRKPVKKPSPPARSKPQRRSPARPRKTIYETTTWVDPRPREWARRIGDILTRGDSPGEGK
jgi:hypothetical protein